jgi:hypothetical protein
MKPSATGKKILSVYIKEDLISKVREEATKQDRTISAQTEVFLRAATKDIGE